jgi:ATP-binding cassette subfamily B protein
VAAAMSGAPAASPRLARPARRRLIGYLLHNRALYALWLLTSVVYVAGWVAVPKLVGWCVAAIGEELPAGDIAERVAWLVGIALATAVVRYFTRTLVFNAARQIEYELRNDIFDHLLKLPQSFYFRWRTGDIMSRCVNDLNAIRLLMGVGLLNMVQTPMLYAVVIGVMLSMNVKLALLVLLPYPLFIVIARTLGRTIHHWSLLTQEGLAQASSQLQEAISGIAVVKAYGMEDITQRRFETVNRALYSRQLGLVRAYAGIIAVTGVLPALAMVVILLVGGGEIAAGRMTVGDFFAFSMYVFQLTFPTFIMGWVVALVQRGLVSMQRIDELLCVEPSIADADDARTPDEVRGEIEFRDLTFRYPGEEAREPALRGVSLRVPAGATLGVVGPVGSGKSTLASLIARLYELEDGQLFVDGIDVNRISLAALRSSIAMVPQEPFLFSMTLGDNVAFGVERAPRGLVVEAATRARLAVDVEDLPDGYDTIVGERGVMLSGGQRQRAALARALALDPAILLLDDTFSAVDAETEVEIQRQLQDFLQGRTVVIVASRVSAVRQADQIVVLEAGRVAELGTHAELVAAGGLYARLAHEQAEEQALVGDAVQVEVGP